MFWSQFKERNKRLALTLVSKQWLVFFIGTALLVFKFVTEEIWAFLACYVIGANVFQKYKGVSSGNPNGDKQSTEFENSAGESSRDVYESTNIHTTKN